MTAHTSAASHGAPQRSRWIPFAALTTSAVLLAAAIATTAGGAAGAATPPNAQSAGNFLDATIGGKPIDQIAKLEFARAQNPGSTSDQNPLNVTLLNSINLPLTGALQFPELLGIKLGAANQVALAKSDGSSYGATGAVLNSGGVSIGGNNSARPANATIDLSASGISGNNPVPAPGGGSADALGGVKASIGAVSSIARVPEFGPPLASSWLDSCTQDSATCYQIASVDLQLGSPLVGQIFGTIADGLDTVLGQLITLAGNVGLPSQCAFTDGFSSISLENGAIVIDSKTGGITIHLKNLLQTLLGKDLNDLSPNTDLLKFLLNYLTSPNGLAAGIEGVINGITTPLSDKFSACLTAIGGDNALANLLSQLTAALTSGQTTLENTINNIISGLDAGKSPLAPIGDLLTKLIDIGINVQPQVSSGDFNSNLDTLPKQGMTPPPVPYQHTVRAIEVQVLPASNGVTLALANSSAGPSHGQEASPSPTNSESVLPTAVPAGQATRATPVMPAVLLALGLMFAAGGVLAYRMRGRLNRH